MKNLLLILTFVSSLSFGQKPDEYFNRANDKAKLQDYRGAIADYSKAIELNPDFSEAYYNRGTCKIILKDKEGACLDWSKAGELGEGDAYDLIKEHCK